MIARLRKLELALTQLSQEGGTMTRETATAALEHVTLTSAQIARECIADIRKIAEVLSFPPYQSVAASSVLNRARAKLEDAVEELEIVEELFELAGKVPLR